MTHSHSIRITSQDQTTDLAQRLCTHLHPGDVVLLDGPLAAGKTFLIRAMVLHWETDDDVSSPTYTIANQYQTQHGDVLHIDAYRLENVTEFHALGLDETLEASICLIEWGSRIQDAFEAPLQITITLDPNDEDSRTITVSGGANWSDLFEALT